MIWKVVCQLTQKENAHFYYRLQLTEGAKIEWYFAEEISLDAVMKLFQQEGITGIDLIFQAAN